MRRDTSFITTNYPMSLLYSSNSLKMISVNVDRFILRGRLYHEKETSLQKLRQPHKHDRKSAVGNFNEVDKPNRNSAWTAEDSTSLLLQLK